MRVSLVIILALVITMAVYIMTSKIRTHPVRIWDDNNVTKPYMPPVKHKWSLVDKKSHMFIGNPVVENGLIRIIFWREVNGEGPFIQVWNGNGYEQIHFSEVYTYDSAGNIETKNVLIEEIGPHDLKVEQELVDGNTVSWDLKSGTHYVTIAKKTDTGKGLAYHYTSDFALIGSNWLDASNTRDGWYNYKINATLDGNIILFCRENANYLAGILFNDRKAREVVIRVANGKVHYGYYDCEVNEPFHLFLVPYDVSLLRKKSDVLDNIKRIKSLLKRN